jgi:hypothetical protein
VIHHGQRLAFGLETGDHLPGIHSKLDDLERDATPHRFLLLGFIDNPAPAFTQFAHQTIGSDDTAGQILQPSRRDVTRRRRRHEPVVGEMVA